jgi:hypothetical protein
MTSPITGWKDVEARGFKPSHWKRPRTGERELTILFRGGMVASGTYTAAQMDWSDRGHAFDCAGYK